ncbi:creatinine amidohydrolase [Thermocladium modestius]|uniref:Creatinine amidohydrolase n=1 Tax=Thermocladium modestius TaxID=62609 RepID=A0A830GXE9_9CREN|nr:creatininase family protein [Thermocladium modestius]GGP22095.1 creatinine amidohydrolase [Thermocladium modestius]
MKWWELSLEEFGKVDKTVAVLPVGIVEAHGPHLPLGTDALMAIYVAEKSSEAANVLMLPPIWYGNTYVLDKFRGTISIDAQALYHLYRSVFKAVADNGVKYLVVVNGHGGNVDALSMAAKDVARETDLVIIIVNWWIDLAREARRKVLETPEGHAAEDETSEVMAAYPSLVKWVPRDGKYDEWVEARFRVYGREAYDAEYHHAVQGYPSKASEEKGRAIMDAAIAEMTGLLNDLKRGVLPLKRVT